MSEDKLKDIIQQKVQQWEQGGIITGEPQPSELVWDKLNASLPAKSWSVLHLAGLFCAIAVLSFGLGFAAYQHMESKKNQQMILHNEQSDIPDNNLVIDTIQRADTSRLVRKRTVEIIDMDSIEESKKKDYILYNNSKIYINKEDSTEEKSVTN